MKTHVLPLPEGYDAQTQAAVGLMAAQLDDQLLRLKADLANLPPAFLEWQPSPGNNTIGMLLAHIATAEAYWLVACATDWDAEEGSDKEIRARTSERVREACGILMEDDGLPLAPGGTHPEALAGKSLDGYLALVDAARARTHRALKGWTDADLAKTYRVRQYGEFSYGWTLYHVLEHFCGHYGQILLLKHMARDAERSAAGQE